ncbi:MAG: glycosyltransferase [Planctomycetota bacterium]
MKRVFVTVGTQLAFDRLIEAMDAWAATAEGVEVFAQIGPSDYQPRHMAFKGFVTPGHCHSAMSAADVIVGHAGMGTILGSLELGKPVLVMPRLEAKGEHRSDHQVATAKRFDGRPGVTVAWDESALPGALAAAGERAARAGIEPTADPELIDAIGGFIRSVKRSRFLGHRRITTDGRDAGGLRPAGSQ